LCRFFPFVSQHLFCRCVLRFPSTSIQIRVEQPRRVLSRRTSVERSRRTRKAEFPIDSATCDSQANSPKRARRPSTPVDLDRYECELFHKGSADLCSTTLVKSGTRRKQALIPTNCCGLRSALSGDDPPNADTVTPASTMSELDISFLRNSCGDNECRAFKFQLKSQAFVEFRFFDVILCSLTFVCVMMYLFF
uniref:Phospholipid scramblase n=1 Tax=Echinostoma caproni TaxID=27848 RepID=A0A183BBH9_9TREM